MNITQSCLEHLNTRDDWGQDSDELAFLHGQDPVWESWKYEHAITDVPTMIRSLEFVFTHPCRDARLAREAIAVPDRLRAVASIQQGVIGMEGESNPHHRTMLMLVAQPNGSTYCLARGHGDHARIVQTQDLMVAPHPEYDADALPEAIERELERLKSLAGAMEVISMSRAL